MRKPKAIEGEQFDYPSHLARLREYRKEEDARDDWLSFPCSGECPVYADSNRFREHLEGRNWRQTVPGDDGCLCDPAVAALMSSRYGDFLTIKAERGR